MPKLNRQQHFEVGQNIAVNQTKTKVVQAGELDQLPDNLKHRKEELEKQNAEGRLGHAETKQWSSQGNQIDVDVTSIKDERQLAYFCSTLNTDDDRLAVMNLWASRRGKNPKVVVSNAEELLGSRLFDTPQTSAGALNAMGLATCTRFAGAALGVTARSLTTVSSLISSIISSKRSELSSLYTATGSR